MISHPSIPINTITSSHFHFQFDQYNLCFYIFILKELKMLTCLPRSKQYSNDDESVLDDPPATKQAIRTLTSQIKDMALKASGPCTGPPTHQRQRSHTSSESPSERFRWSLRRNGSSNSRSEVVNGRVWGKEMEARLKGISSGEGTLAASASGRRPVVVLVEEKDPQEWVAQIESGVLITFVSLPRGGNDLKRIRFSREMFNKWQAQRWWVENYDKVMELYNVQKLNRHAFPLPTPPRSEDENLKIEPVEDSPVTPPLSSERLPRTLYHPTAGMGMSYSSSDSLDQHHPMQQSRFNNDSCGLTTTPKHSSISGAKTETSSMDASIRSSSSRDIVDCLSISNASDLETEWVEQDEPGVYITIKALATGARELRRVRFSREKFGEIHARLWWEENRARVHKQYL